MKADQATQKVRKKMKKEGKSGLVEEYRILGRILQEKVHCQIESRAGENPSRSAVGGSVKELDDWVRVIANKLGWSEGLRELFLADQKRKVYWKHGHTAPKFQQYDKAFRQILTFFPSETVVKVLSRFVKAPVKK